MALLRIRSRIPKADARQLVRALPGVLSSRLPDRFGLGASFRARVGVELLRLIYTSFQTKAQGHTDVLSERWKPLKKATIRQKEKLGLSPYRARLINRRSDTLINSLKPAGLAGRHYKPRENQVFDVDGPFVIVGTSVEHAKYVHRKRPLWPKAARLGAWVAQTVRAGRDEVLNVLTRRLGA